MFIKKIYRIIHKFIVFILFKLINFILIKSDFSIIPAINKINFSNFIYSDLSLSSQTISPVDTLIVKVKVKNTSNLSGKEVIQLYISDTYASITPSVKKLIAFDKQFIEKGKEITVVFKITKDDLTFVDKNNSSIYEEGDFEIYISNLTNKFILKK